MLDADQVREEAVPPRLSEHTLARVDQDHGKVRGRGASDHVARILFVPRGIGDDELALLGREKAVGDIDRDPLLALGGEAVYEQREVDLLPLRADALAVGFERGELVLENHLRVIKQAADQRRFAVVDRAAGDEAQQRFLLMLFEIGVDVLGDQRVCDVDRRVGGIWHQKYPSCFFFSIDASPPSLSMMRPWRSLVVVSSIS